jgi:hypothetical protein
MLRSSPYRRYVDSFEISTVALHRDTRGVLIIPQNSKFIYNKFI